MNWYKKSITLQPPKNDDLFKEESPNEDVYIGDFVVSKDGISGNEDIWGKVVDKFQNSDPKVTKEMGDLFGIELSRFKQGDMIVIVQGFAMYDRIKTSNLKPFGELQYWSFNVSEIKKAELENYEINIDLYYSESIVSQQQVEQAKNQISRVFLDTYRKMGDRGSISSNSQPGSKMTGTEDINFQINIIDIYEFVDRVISSLSYIKGITIHNVWTDGFGKLKFYLGFE